MNRYSQRQGAGKLRKVNRQLNLALLDCALSSNETVRTKILLRPSAVCLVLKREEARVFLASSGEANAVSSIAQFLSED
jgi:hypothetical protein